MTYRYWSLLLWIPWHFQCGTLAPRQRAFADLWRGKERASHIMLAVRRVARNLTARMFVLPPPAVPSPAILWVRLSSLDCLATIGSCVSDYHNPPVYVPVCRPFSENSMKSRNVAHTHSLIYFLTNIFAKLLLINPDFVVNIV